ncbi:NAD(P)-dependent oxidoreductase [Leucobacter allii]|uniref:NAD(P)-dependent oxidoreductase n=1 Tax=Leucobacter allii TaxID=2932247 RepID=UPI001FD31535|nr:NAD(P)-dependent oxidoreductase [Leucobacter allii]UOR01368.1 NAD(P)-dependent oxidoreductase [Leucobacter allii]
MSEEAMTTPIGFIGLGTMGSAMAQRLAEAGHPLHVWNRTPGKAPGVISAGGVECGSVSEVLDRSDIVLSMLANDAAADAAFSAEALSGARGTLHVNLATVSIEMSRVLAERHRAAGVGYISAPVLGRPDVAAAGRLNIVAAGPADLVERAEPVLALLGKRTWNVGTDPAQANLVKIGVNYNLIHAMQALGESLSLVEHGGIDSETFVEILTDAAFTGSAYVGYGGIIAKRAYRPAAFPVELGLKDLTLAQEAAAELGAELPTAPTIRDMFAEALGDPELSDGDWSIIAEVIRRGPSAA